MGESSPPGPRGGDESNAVSSRSERDPQCPNPIAAAPMRRVGQDLIAMVTTPGIARPQGGARHPRSVRLCFADGTHHCSEAHTLW